VSEAAQQLVEHAMRAEHGEPSCKRCASEQNCLIAFMGPAVSIKPSYVAAPGCGRFDPKSVEHGGEDADQGSEKG